MTQNFASTGDLADKETTFAEIGKGIYAFTAEGDPNSGVVIGDDSVLVVEAQATPQLAERVIAEIRIVTDKPISHLVLTHYHAVRVLGASAYGASQVIMSETARSMVAERGIEDWKSEFQRFPRLFKRPRNHSRIDLADDDFFGPNDGLSRKPQSRNHAFGARPYCGRRSGLGAGRTSHVYR